MGATTIESPVWTPIGSRFSMPQMAMVVSAASRSTSNSISYQPSSERSTSTWPMGLAARPVASRWRASSGREGEAAPAAAQGEGGAHHHRRVERRHEAHPVLDRLDHRALRDRLADPGHQVAEPAPILRGAHSVERRAEHADRVALEDAGVVERNRQVEPGLAAERRQQRVGPMLGDHPLQVLHRERRDHHGAAHVRIGHHRGRVRVDQHGLDPLAAQRQAGLHPGVVELGSLADEDRSRADDQHLLRQGHAMARSNARSKTREPSIGPGAPSGWNWTDAIRPERCASPSTVPSLRSRWLTW